MVSQIAMLDIKDCVTVGAPRKEGKDIMGGATVILPCFEKVVGRKKMPGF